MTPEQIITVMNLLFAQASEAAGFPAIAAGGADPRYPVTVEACPQPLPPAEVEGKTVICGRIAVPENHDHPDGKRINLAFAVLKARTQAPVPDPVVYLHGGPGGGAVRDLATIVSPLWDGYRQRRDVVTFDQRAAGISSDMVTCFETFGANIYDIMVPKNFTDEKQKKMFSSCFAELKSKGTDLTSYNTVQNAKDVRAVMSALGYPTYNIYGVSYGTKLALEVQRSASEGVRSVVIDSVAPPNARFYDENILPVEEGVQAVVDLCREDAGCNKAFPELDKTINRVAEKLRLNPIPAARGRPEITVATMISLFEGRNSAGRWPNVTAHIPLILTEWDRGETRTWDMLSSGGTARTPTTADRLKPFDGKLTQEQRALAALLLDQAAALGAQEHSLGAAMQALTASLTRSAAGVTELAKRFDDTVTRSIISTGSKEAMLAFLKDYAALVNKSPDRLVLRKLVTDHLPLADAAQALAIVDTLSESDVAAVFKSVSTEARTAIGSLVMTLDLAIVACQEDIPFNSKEGLQAANAAVKYPFLLQSSMAAGEIFGFCEMIPPALPVHNFHDAVESNIPTLVIYGLADTQTSMKDAKLAASTLKNSQVVGFPEAGHAALIFSQCAKDIGLAFIERPDEPVNAACTASLKPKWALPAH